MSNRQRAGRRAPAMQRAAAAIIRGDIVQGYENQSPYDAILIEGRVKKVPVKILKQLNDKGKLAVVENNISNFGNAVIYERYEDNFIKKTDSDLL